MSEPRHDPFAAAGRYLETGRDPDRELPPDEQRRLDQVRALLADESTWAQPPPEMLEDILAEVDAEAETRGGRTRGGRPSPAPRRAWGRWALGGLAAAAAIVVVLALAINRSGGDGGGATTEVALAGTELAPKAHAEATLKDTPSGVDITLHVEGLAPAPEGFYYQAWVKGPAGTVAIGTFHVRHADDRPVRLWSGVDMAKYPQITVTLEPEDGNPASSGRKVLGGSQGGG